MKRRKWETRAKRMNQELPAPAPTRIGRVFDWLGEHRLIGAILMSIGLALLLMLSHATSAFAHPRALVDVFLVAWIISTFCLLVVATDDRPRFKKINFLVHGAAGALAGALIPMVLGEFGNPVVAGAAIGAALGSLGQYWVKWV